MKKIFALIVAAAVLFSFAACTKTEENLTLGGTLKKQFIEIVEGGETDPFTKGRHSRGCGKCGTFPRK